jgi:hypothetical protein
VGISYYGNFVVPDSLATATDYTTWTSKAAPTNIAPLLRACTSMVLDATEGAYYDTDPLTGVATDPRQLAAMRDAVCIQAAAWVVLGIDPLTGGVLTSTVKKSKKLATASIEYADADAATAARTAAYNHLVPEAARKLQQNNLVGSGPWTFG